MTIAAHISAFNIHLPQKNFNYQNLTLLAGLYPEHHFIFIFDSIYDPQTIKHTNITPVSLGPSIKSRLLRHYWYNFKIPGLLKKYNADIFICSGVICSLRSTIKQFIYLPDLSFLQTKNLYSDGDKRYLKKYFKRFVEKAACIGVGTGQLLLVLSEIYPGSHDKIRVIQNDFGMPMQQSDDDIKIQRMKTEYSEGKEYFIFFVTEASVENVLVVLKAFSLFKKRLLSNMQLILSVSPALKGELIKDLATYRYRNEIRQVLCESDLENMLTAASYAAIYLPGMEILENKGLLALKNNIPLITMNNVFLESLYKEAALYTNIDEKNIAEKMMLLYKEENVRTALINAGRKKALEYSPGSTAARLWHVLTDTAAQSS